MTVRPDGPPESVTADVTLSGPDWQLRAKMTVPAGPARLIELLPLVRSLADSVVGAAAGAAEEQGQAVSCKKGCGACCRQLVPIAEVEARRIGDLIDGLPEPRRSEVRARFAGARRRLQEAGLLDRLLYPEGWHDEDRHAVGTEYFRQGVACPFLEGESCSIYADRPVACREYLVTSPAENCARPSAETVRCVRLPLKVSAALHRVEGCQPAGRFLRWVPLVLAPEWAEAHPDGPLPRPGPELLRELFDHLTGKGAGGPRPEPAPGMGG
jgi:Fe-S-cluster containining protein